MPHHALSLFHHDLRSNTCAAVPQDFRHKLSPAVQAAIGQSRTSHHFAPIQDTPFQVFADYSAVTQGIAYFVFSPAVELGAGKAPPGSVLYIAVVACELGTAPLAWRHIVGPYMREASVSGANVPFAAIETMPKEVPWLIGFPSVRASSLAADLKKELVTLVRLAGCFLFWECLDGVDQSINDGEHFFVSPEKYHELTEEGC